MLFGMNGNRLKRDGKTPAYNTKTPKRVSVKLLTRKKCIPPEYTFFADPLSRRGKFGNFYDRLNWGMEVSAKGAPGIFSERLNF